MAIFPHPTPPHKGGGVGMGQYFVLAPWGGVGMGLVFSSPPCLALPCTNKDYNCKFSKP